MVACLANKSSSWEIGIKGRKRFNSAWSLSLPPHQADSPHIFLYVWLRNAPLPRPLATPTCNSELKRCSKVPPSASSAEAEDTAAGSWQLATASGFWFHVGCVFHSTLILFLFHFYRWEMAAGGGGGDCRRLMLLFYAIKCLFALLYLNWALPTLRWYMFPPLFAWHMYVQACRIRVLNMHLTITICPMIPMGIFSRMCELNDKTN